MGCSLINGGSGYPFLSPPIYQYIAGTPLQDVTASIQHVPTQNVKAVLDKVHTIIVRNVKKCLPLPACEGNTIYYTYR